MCAQLAGRALTDDEVEAHQRISAEIPSQDAVASVWTDLGMAVREVPGGRPTTRSEVDAFFGSVMRAAEQRRSHHPPALFAYVHNKWVEDFAHRGAELYGGSVEHWLIVMRKHTDAAHTEAGAKGR